VILQRYTLREMISPFFLGFSFVTFLLLMEFLLDYLELILEKGVPVWDVVQLFVLGLGWMMALSIPCGVLVGALMTFGRMSQDNEILAMRASGVPMIHLLMPVFGWGLFWTVALLAFNNYVLPWTNYRFSELLLEVNRAKPAAELDEGVFVDAFDGHRLLFDELDPKTGEIRGVKILEFQSGDRLTTTTATSGRLTYDQDQDVLLLELHDGEMNGVPSDAANGETFRRTTYRDHTIAIHGEAQDYARRSKKKGQREMSAGELLGEVRSNEEKRENLIAEQDSILAQRGYASFAELRAIVKGREPWWTHLLGPFLPRSSVGDLPTERRFVGPPDVQTYENYRMAELQVGSFENHASQFRVEYHKKFSLAAACLIFVLLGAPLGILVRRGGMRAGVWSIAFFIFYYICLIAGEQLADRRLVRPWLAMWLANLVLGSVGLYLVLKVTGRDLRPRKSS